MQQNPVAREKVGAGVTVGIDDGPERDMFDVKGLGLGLRPGETPHRLRVRCTEVLLSQRMPDKSVHSVIDA